MAEYLVLVGVDYPPNRRAEPGDIVDDLPGKSIKWLTQQGIVEKVKPQRKPETKLVAPPDIEPEPMPGEEPLPILPDNDMKEGDE